MVALTDPLCALLVPREPLNQIAWDILRASVDIIQSVGIRTYLAFDDGKDDDIVELLCSMNPSLVVAVSQLRPELDELLTQRGIESTSASYLSGGGGQRLVETQLEIMSTMVRHLSSYGLKKLAYVQKTGPEVDGLANLRHLGVLEECSKLSLPTPLCLTFDLNRDDQAGILLQAYRQNGEIEGFCCYNDEVAMAVCHGLRQIGKAVPHDARVIGIDNLAQSAYTSPTLTSVAYNYQAVAAQVTKTMMSRFGVDTSQLELNEQAGIKLVLRESA